MTELQAKKKTLQETRVESAERTKALADLAEQKRRQTALDEQLKKYAANDPAKLKRLEQGVATCRDAANRWTDNIFVVMGYYRKRGMEVKTGEMLKHFGLPEDMDEIPR